MEISELAKYAGSFFLTKTRVPETPGAEGKRYVSMKKRRPTWISDMVKKVHDNGNWFPEDYKYEYIDQSLDLLADGVNPEEPQLEADVYTSDLYEWFTSHSERAGYVDEATKSIGHSEQGIVGDFMMGQLQEREEVFRLVVDSLTERLKEIDLGEDEVFEGPKKSPLDWSPREEKE